MLDFIERLRAKPEHVRRRIAIGASGSITALAALIWVTAFTSSNAFALNTPAAPADMVASGKEIQGSFGEASNGFSNLLGAVGGSASPSNEPVLIIVEEKSTSTFEQRQAPVEERTVIPF